MTRIVIQKICPQLLKFKCLSPSSVDWRVTLKSRRLLSQKSWLQNVQNMEYYLAKLFGKLDRGDGGEATGLQI